MGSYGHSHNTAKVVDKGCKHNCKNRLTDKGEIMLNCIVVGAGGFIGTILRYLTGLIPVKETTVFPVKTFMINILGCLAIGSIAALTAKNLSLSPKLVLFLKVGICGGFTTFSTFALETTELMKNGHLGIAFLYLILSTVLGISAVFLADILIQRV